MLRAAPYYPQPQPFHHPYHIQVADEYAATPRTPPSLYGTKSPTLFIVIMLQPVVYLSNSAVSAAMANTNGAGSTLKSVEVYSHTAHSTVGRVLHSLPAVVAQHSWEPTVSVGSCQSRLRRWWRSIKLVLLKDRNAPLLTLASPIFFTADVAELMTAETHYEL